MNRGMGRNVARATSHAQSHETSHGTMKVAWTELRDDPAQGHSTWADPWAVVWQVYVSWAEP